MVVPVQLAQVRSVEMVGGTDWNEPGAQMGETVLQVTPVKPASFWKEKPAEQGEHTRGPFCGRLEVKKPGEQPSRGLQAVWPVRSWKVLGGQLEHTVLDVGVAGVEMKVPGPHCVALVQAGRMFGTALKDCAGQGRQPRSLVGVGLDEENQPAGHRRVAMQLVAPWAFWKVPAGQGLSVQAVQAEPAGQMACAEGDTR